MLKLEKIEWVLLVALFITAAIGLPNVAESAFKRVDMATQEMRSL